MGFVDPEHVKHPEWGPFRRSVVAVQGRQCALCGEQAPFPFIQPRNIFYTEGRLPWEYDVDEMQVVCRSCFYGAMDGTRNVLTKLREYSQDEQMQILTALRHVYNSEGPRSTGIAWGFLKLVENEVPPVTTDEADLDYMTRRAETSMLALPKETLVVVLQSLILLGKVPVKRRGEILGEI